MNAGPVVDSVGWTLLHFTWQGALIGLETALALFLLRKRSAETRYLVACTGLLLCLLWPAIELALRLDAAGSGATGFAIALANGVSDGEQSGGLRALLGRHLAWIVGAWSACAMVMALRMLAGLMWVQRAATVGKRDPAWQACLDRLATRGGVGRPVRLRIVAGIASPVTAGWWRPVVLVPAALVSGMPPQLLEALLAHELAHIRRHDYLVNLFQNMIETLLFYHPAVWWISRRIRVERELIADSIAARQLGEPRRLALALSELEKLQFSHHHLAQAANGGDLMQRIKQLLHPTHTERQSPNWKAAIPVLALSIAGLVGCAQTPSNSGVTVMADTITTEPVANFNSCARPVYPKDAHANRIEGTVSLRFLVSVDSRVLDSVVRQSSGNAALDQAAQSALTKCSFKPATANGKPVQEWANVQYVWKA